MQKDSCVFTDEDLKLMQNVFGKPKKCALCGKEMISIDWSQYAYKLEIRDKQAKNNRMRYYCSWGCICKAKREIEQSNRYKISERRY